jgi:hypothetical protein
MQGLPTAYLNTEFAKIYYEIAKIYYEIAKIYKLIFAE